MCVLREEEFTAFAQSDRIFEYDAAEPLTGRRE